MKLEHSHPAPQARLVQTVKLVNIHQLLLNLALIVQRDTIQDHKAVLAQNARQVLSLEVQAAQLVQLVKLEPFQDRTQHLSVLLAVMVKFQAHRLQYVQVVRVVNIHLLVTPVVCLANKGLTALVSSHLNVFYAQLAHTVMKQD